MTTTGPLAWPALTHLPFAQVSPYYSAFAALALVSGVTLAVLLPRRSSGGRRPLGWRLELLLITAVLSAAVAAGHELLTDDLCHGACL